MPPALLPGVDPESAAPPPPKIAGVTRTTSLSQADIISASWKRTRDADENAARARRPLSGLAYVAPTPVEGNPAPAAALSITAVLATAKMATRWKRATRHKFYSHALLRSAAQVYRQLQAESDLAREINEVSKVTDGEVPGDVVESAIHRTLDVENTLAKCTTSEDSLSPMRYRHNVDPNPSEAKTATGFNAKNAQSTRSREALVLGQEAFGHRDVYEKALFVTKFYVKNYKSQIDRSLAVVIFYFFHKHGFNFGVGGLRLNHGLNEKVACATVAAVEDAIRNHKTKLNGYLARERIDAKVPTIADLLPDTVKENVKYCNQRLVGMRVNRFKTWGEECINQLTLSGFKRVPFPGADENNDCSEHSHNSLLDTQLSENEFCVDFHFEDLLLFSHSGATALQELPIFLEHHLIPHDKAGCVPASALDLNLLAEGGNIIITHASSASMVTHVASKARENDANVLAFGCDMASLPLQLRDYAVDNVQCFGINFVDCDPRNTASLTAKQIIVNPSSTLSGIIDKASYTLQENLLNLPSSFALSLPKNFSKLNAMQLEALTHASKFRNVETFIYYTRSTNQSENEDILNQALAQYDTSIFEIDPGLFSSLPISSYTREKETSIKRDGKENGGPMYWMDRIVTQKLDPKGDHDIKYRGCLRVRPSRHIEGFFAARVQKKAPVPEPLVAVAPIRKMKPKPTEKQIQEKKKKEAEKRQKKLLKSSKHCFDADRFHTKASVNKRRPKSVELKDKRFPFANANI